MAGFAVDIGDEGTAYAQGVTMPSATSASVAAEGLSMIGRGVFGALDSMDKARRAAQPTESAINREAFSSLSKDLDEAKGESPLQQRTIVAEAITKYNHLGFDIGVAEASMIKQRTGIDVDYLNFDINPQQAARDATIEKIQANPAYYYIALDTLEKAGKPFTEKDVLDLAMADVQRSESAALYLVNAKNITRKEFLETYVPNANLALENIRLYTLRGLAIETEGGSITPENVVQLRSKFDVVKATFTKPPLIETSDWQVIQSQIDTLDQLLTTLENYDENVLAATKADYLEAHTRALMLQDKELGQKDPILYAAMLSGKVDMTPYFSTRMPLILETLDSIKAEDTVYTDLFATPEIVEGEDSTSRSTTDEPSTDSLHDLEEVTKAEERSNQDRKNSIIFAATQRIGIMKPPMMDQPEHRANFLAGIGQATVNISTTGELFGRDTLNLVYNDDTYSKLALIRNLDPEKAKLATLRLIDGLQAQANVRMAMASGELADSIFEIKAVGEVGFREVGPDISTAFQRQADRFYGGNIFRMLKDYQNADIQIKTDLRKRGFDLDAIGIQYNKITKLNTDLQYYIKNLRKLGVDTSTIERTVLQKQEADQPVDSQTTQEEEEEPVVILDGLSEDEQKVIYDNLPSTTKFIDPSDGKTYRKP